jgi:hypothetical protein
MNRIEIGVYLFVTVWAALMESREEFYVLAVSVGLVQGGIQALSRSLFAGMIPEGKSARYFGFYNMIGKFAAVMGPVLIGTTGLVLRSLGASAETATRLGITSISILFIGNRYKCRSRLRGCPGSQCGGSAEPEDRILLVSPDDLLDRLRVRFRGGVRAEGRVHAVLEDIKITGENIVS